MKLRNKKTGEIMYLLFNSYPVSGDIVLEYMDENAESGYSEYCRYKTLSELNAEWEDAPEEQSINNVLLYDLARQVGDLQEIVKTHAGRIDNIDTRLRKVENENRS